MALYKSWSEKWNKKSVLSRNILLFTWSVSTMILVFAFCSNLRAELILPEYEKPVNTFEDITDQTLVISKLRMKGLKFSILENVKKLVAKGKVSTDIQNDNRGFEEMERVRQCRLNNRETAVDIQLGHQKKNGKTPFHIST